MTVKQAIKILRAEIGRRDEHHSNCESNYQQDLSKCDCYARGREESHQALDLLERLVGKQKADTVP